MSTENLKELNSILEKDDSLEEAHLQKAAYELLSKQFLYREKKLEKRHYGLIVTHITYFRKLMRATGHRLVHEEHLGYVGIIPTEFTRQMSVEETLILLTLRSVYDEEVQNFNSLDDGCIDILVENFMLKYEHLTGRDRPEHKRDVIELFQPMIRIGLVKYRQELEHGDAWVLRIYPSITALINSDSLGLMEAYMKAKDIDTDVQEDEA